ncbi:MAG: hypothetical protein K0Q59_264 [Paenibacillus sp.]|nr:hypothetical protein [Paenibacillus sp.]
MLSSFGFRYTERSAELLRIYTIGMQKVEGEGYDFHGLQRNTGGLLFQYTLSGEGRLEVGDKRYTVPKHHAFLVDIPGDHRYYYDPSGGKPWEVLWVRFDGPLALTYWKPVQEMGPVLPFDKDSAPIRLLLQLYADVKGERLKGAIEQSVRLYEWLTFMWDYSMRGGMNGAFGHKQLFPHAIQLMKEQFHRPLTLEDMAGCERLSKYHFCKQFHHKIGMSPIAYLNKLRIEEAVSLLANTSLSIGDIARLTGFDTPGYFAKVFRRLVGCSPTEHRESKHEPAASVMRIY